MPFALVGTIDRTPVCHFLAEGRQTIGRSSSTDIHLNYPLVSRVHAAITVDGRRVVVEDLGSRNGTRVDGRLAEGPVEAKLGCSIEFAELTFKLVDTHPEARAQYALDDESLESSSVTLRDVYEYGEPDAKSKGLFQVLVDAGELLAAHRGLDELYQVTLELVERAVCSQRAVLLLVEADEEDPVVIASRLPEGTTDADLVLSRTMVRRVLKDGAALLTTDAQSDPRFKEKQSVIAQRIRSAMAAPLFDNERIIGILYADTTDPACWYSEDELKTFVALANLIAVKITQARLAHAEEERRRLEHELGMAKEILSFILPSEIETLEGYEAALYHMPCLEVGGDLYDVHRLPDGKVLIVTGDVAGKGIAAALLVSNLLPIVRLLTVEAPALPDLAAKLNRQVCQSTDPIHFATLFLGLLDPASGRLDYVNAGHPPPLVIDADGTISRIDATGMPLGMLEDSRYRAGSIHIRPGATLAMFSDGIPDAENPAGELFQIPRLRDALARARSASARDIVDRVRADLDAFTEGTPQVDDVTILLIRRPPDPGGADVPS
jgi:serine phosphatase RsbU (regulator of sigma subunit)/pSer/pThr/pTyr-binding forkhead associated (FHA) protein